MKNKTAGLVVAWLATRAWMFFTGIQVLPYPHNSILFADVRLYDWWAANLQDGHFPINDPMWQYPPLAAVIFLVGYLIAPLTIGFVFLALAFDALTFYFLYEAGTAENEKNFLPATVWVLAAPLMGPIMIGRFDVFPTFFAVIALIFASNRKLFGTLVAIGAFLKMWPALLFLGIKKVDLKHSILWFVGTCVVLATSLTLWWPDSFSFITGQKERGLQIESVAALPYMFWHSVVSPLVVEFRYGAIEVVASGIGLTSAIITLIAIALLGQLAYWQISGKLTQTPTSLVATYAVAVSMVTSRVLSPQYILWLIGLLAVCALNPSMRFKQIFILVAFSAFLGQVMYPYLYNGYMSGEIFPLIVQSARVLTLITATYLMWADIKNQAVTN